MSTKVAKSRDEFVFVATDTRLFVLDSTTAVTLEVMDTEETFCWRLIVDGVQSEPYFNYQGILAHEGCGVVTGYYAPNIKEFVPFRISYASEVK